MVSKPMRKFMLDLVMGETNVFTVGGRAQQITLQTVIR